MPLLWIPLVSVDAEEASSAAAPATNPLANVKAFNLQDCFVGRLTETTHCANQLWLRYAQPFAVSDGRWLMRASLPVNRSATGNRGKGRIHLGASN